MPGKPPRPSDQLIGRRAFTRLSLAAATAVVSGCGAANTSDPSGSDGTSPPRTAKAPAVVNVSQSSYVGDYSPGNFSQWWVQCKDYNVAGSSFPGTYSASILTDATHGHAARFEVRTGDVPPFGGGERSEVSGDSLSGGSEGQIRSYNFATKFDATFPTNHAGLGWGLTNQWNNDVPAGSPPASPPMSWSVSEQNGYWTLVAERQSSLGGYLGQVPLFRTPINVGNWHDVHMQVSWSGSDSTGFVRLWLNGVRQTFIDGSQTYYVRTLIPGSPAGPNVYYKEGYYRQNGIAPTGIVYHTGFTSTQD